MYECVGVRVEIEVVFLHVLAVIAFVAGQAEDPFFQDRIAPVPQRQGKADRLVTIADAGDAVFVPAIGARTGMIVRKVIPRRAARAVVFAHRAPGTFAQIRSPALPMFGSLTRFFQSLFFSLFAFLRVAQLRSTWLFKLFVTEFRSCFTFQSTPLRGRQDREREAFAETQAVV